MSDFKTSNDDVKSSILRELKDLFAESSVKINIEDAIDQISKSPGNLKVRQYLSREYRFVELMAERSRRAAQQTYDFIDREMSHALFHPDQFAVLRDRKDQIASVHHHILDLGVYKGGSTRALARMFPNSIIHGFDSFEGLPEDWSHAPKGSFGEVGGVLPDMPENVKLYKGWFSDTLPGWAKANGSQNISLLRVDCDIYSSTKTIFDEVGHLVHPGTWICFDELIGYYGWQHHEYKAFMEFIEKRKLNYQYVAYGLTYTIAKIV